MELTSKQNKQGNGSCRNTTLALSARLLVRSSAKNEKTIK